MSVKSVSAIAAALVLAVASWWWLRGAGTAPSEASAIGAQPSHELVASARDASDTTTNERQVAAIAANDGGADHDSHDAALDLAARALDEEFEPRLDAIADSFLTEQPDFRGLAALWDEVAAGASVVPDSVRRDDWGVKGELSIPGSSGPAKFEIVNDSYRVSFDKLRAQGDESPYFLRTVTLAFQHKSGVVTPGSSSVQFHPDTRRSAANELGSGGERLLGWTVSEHDRHVQASPITARAADDAKSWMIGHSPTRSDIAADYGVDGRAEQALFDLLAKQAANH